MKRRRYIFSDSACRRFRNEDEGATLLTFALGLTTLVFGVGMAIDIGLAHNAKSKAQAYADTIALNAAVYMRDNDSPPADDSKDAYVHAKVYTATELGMDFGGMMSGDPTVRVEYDTVTGEAVATVDAATKTSFTHIFGYTKLDIGAVSTVKFAENEVSNPASIVMIADNSGSMEWHDKPITWNSDGTWNPAEDSQKRIDGLEDAMKSLMSDLDSRVGKQKEEGSRVLRTGLIPYDSAVIDNRVVSMGWGTLTNGNIESMTPSGATNSSPPMDKAEGWLDGEQAFHDNETESEALMFAIFLTDGVNTTGGYSWKAESGTNYWRKWECSSNGNSNNNGNGNGNSNSNGNGNANSCSYNHTWSTTSLTGDGYEEGKYFRDTDTLTTTTCTSMKAKGYRVFTIGFALEPGWYYEGNGNKDDGDNYEYISAIDSGNAYAMLGGCASNPDDFVKAEDVDGLKSAFEHIGSEIAKEVIRVSM